MTKMSKKVLKTQSKSYGPYSSAVWAGDLLYISGTVGYSKEADRILTDDIEMETHQVMRNIQEILGWADLTWNDVVKTSIFLNDMNDFEEVNAIYARYFDIETAPARETIEVSRLPKDANVEISVIASK